MPIIYLFHIYIYYPPTPADSRGSASALQCLALRAWLEAWIGFAPTHLCVYSQLFSISFFSVLELQIYAASALSSSPPSLPTYVDSDLLHRSAALAQWHMMPPLAHQYSTLWNKSRMHKKTDSDRPEPTTLPRTMWNKKAILKSNTHRLTHVYTKVEPMLFRICLDLPLRRLPNRAASSLTYWRKSARSHVQESR